MFDTTQNTMRRSRDLPEGLEFRNPSILMVGNSLFAVSDKKSTYKYSID